MAPRQPITRVPHGGPSGMQYQRLHALGQIPAQPAAPFTNHQPDQWEGWSEIPSFYTVSVYLGGNPNDVAAGSAPLRPEPFVLKRITFSCVDDVITAFPFCFNSPNARCIEVAWQDEFTRFFGEQPCLMAAAFGDSNGYLDLPAPLLFQGRQTLQVNLKRLKWPYDPASLAPQTSRIDFQFQGVALLPPGVGSSGSV